MRFKKKLRMAEVLVGVSQYSLLVLRPRIGVFGIIPNRNSNNNNSIICCSSTGERGGGLRQLRYSWGLRDRSDQRQWVLGAAEAVSSDPILSLDSIEPDIITDSAGGGGDRDGFGDRGGGGGGGGGGGNNNNNKGEGGSDDNSNKMSMSQKLTLAYAALVGVGGVMGYLKSGSRKSLLAGGLSASLLYYVYTQLPTSPVLASSVGLGLSAALLVVMGSRFKKSGKMFPAGVVSLVSLIMTGGYLHGIMRSLH